ncbi:creatininase [Crenobacter sp. SG2303]|uniref:Creatininase n=1 Tax=Crenobacter oryzisoli TaxID=3056844 RepID=A0ABT7XU59_9NEIS|nr:creatininase [Crenobacter sp. SG2303]MDN0076331.1 creatininase [Crenobacter sp. SG2303]MDN0077342.1 creatininase [Crenobacter sp. SG2303]
MAEITWTEYQHRIKEESPVVLIPVGALEQHGPHLPMGTDHLIPTAISRLVAEEVAAIVAPPFNYGYKSQPRMGGGNHFCGTTSLDGHTLSIMLRDVIKEFARHGVRRIAVMDGHYENMMFLIEGIDLALRELRYEGIHDLKILRIEYWDFTSNETLTKVFPDGFPGYALEHAAVMETSMSLYLHPHLVRLEKLPDDPPADFPPYDVYPLNPAWTPASGVLSPAHGASADKGKNLIDEYVQRIATALKDEFPGI